MSKKWAIGYDKCVRCETTDRPHKAKGLCMKCYPAVLHAESKPTVREFICQNCGITFSPPYKIQPSKIYKFCPKECTILGQGKKKSKYETALQLEKAMIQIIKDKGQYIPKAALCKLAGVCAEKTFDKFGLSVIKLHKKAGVKKRNRYSSEYVTYFLLADHIADLESEKTFDDCRSITGKHLKFDFYSEKHNLLFEVDGDHHRWNTTQKVLLFLQECDVIKERYADEKGIHFLRIPIAPKQQITLEFLTRYLLPFITGA
jgi:hypothetical protein